MGPYLQSLLNHSASITIKSETIHETTGIHDASVPERHCKPIPKALCWMSKLRSITCSEGQNNSRVNVVAKQEDLSRTYVTVRGAVTFEIVTYVHLSENRIGQRG